MIADNRENAKAPSKKGKWMPWFNFGLSIVLIALGIWYLAGKVSLADIVQAILLAKPLYIVLGLVVMLVTVLLKAWRWWLMFYEPVDKPRFAPMFWSLMLGQYVNLIVPFFRVGEVARIYALNRQTDIKMARALGTLVVEKVLDAMMFALSLAIILPFVILPEFVGEPGFILWTVPVAALFILYLLAYQTKLITRLFQAITAKIPVRFGKRLLQWSVSGLEGLSSLRSKRLILLLVGSSAIIAMLSVLLPYILFLAFDMQLGLVEAAVINAVVTIATTPPSTPGKIGVFNGVVAFMLASFGLKNEAVIIGYSIVFHLVVIVPQIIIGAIAASRTNWRWQKMTEQRMVT